MTCWLLYCTRGVTRVCVTASGTCAATAAGIASGITARSTAGGICSSGPGATGCAARIRARVIAVAALVGTSTIAGCIIVSGSIGPVRSVIVVAVIYFAGPWIIVPVVTVIIFTAATVVAVVGAVVIAAGPADIVRIVCIVPAIIVTISRSITLVIPCYHIPSVIVHIHGTVGADDHVRPVIIIAVIVVAVSSSMIYGPVAIRSAVVAGSPPAAGPVIPGAVTAEPDTCVEPA